MNTPPEIAQNGIGPGLDGPGNLSIEDAIKEMERARQIDNLPELNISLIRLAHLHFRQGHYDQAQKLASEVLHNSTQKEFINCDALRILGNCAAELGDPIAAEAYYHQAIDMARQMGYKYSLYKCLHSLATNIYWPRGQFELTLATGKEALLQAQALQLGEELWFPLSDIAWVYWSTGQRNLALDIADQMEKVVSPGSLGDGFTCCLQAGLVVPVPGFLDKVLPYYQRARSIAEKTGDPGLNVEVRLGLCRSYRAAGNLPAAIAWADDAVKVTMRTSYRQFQAIALIERGRTAMALDDQTISMADFQAAAEIAGSLQADFDLARIALYQAVLLFTQKNLLARSAWEYAAGLIKKHGYAFLLEQERILILPLIAAGLDDRDSNLVKTSRELYDQFLEVTPPPLTIQMLGDFSVWVGARLVSKELSRQRRAGELLALLLTSMGHVLTYSQVAMAMCPEKDSNAALDFYHHAISSLRHLLEPDLPDRRFACRYLHVDDERIKLILPEGTHTDLQEFEAAFQAKDWERAILVYRGEFLPVFKNAEWAVPRRQHLADRYEFALLAMAQSKLIAGDPAACLGYCQRVLLRTAWQEQAVMLGMQAAIALNDRTTAIKLYQRLEKVLEKEFGIAPQKELQAIYTAVRQRSLK